MPHITGHFDITLTPQAAAPGIEAAQLGRQTINKQFHGELAAHSLGEMLAAMSAVQGSAGYVAMERVDGTHEILTGTDSAELNPGDVFVIETPGGGGYGVPV